MVVIRGEEADIEGVLEVAKLMCVSARTAPKTYGVDDILTAIITGEDKDKLADEMEKYSEEHGEDYWWVKRDAENVRNSAAVVLIGVRGTKSAEGLNCGACGYPSCAEMEKAVKTKGKDFIGPNCMYKLLDLGIAIGSAVKTASIHNVDNRVMTSVGTAAMKLGLMPEASVIMGIPLAALGKNPYFDRRGKRRYLQ
ncbi:MAG TPA: hypothetical protein ENF82_03170 [Candidatus Methanomethylia archaeon]|nr:hypothetical protein [Candidatus Methanomethylicia archaeon]